MMVDVITALVVVAFFGTAIGLGRKGLHWIIDFITRRI